MNSFIYGLICFGILSFSFWWLKFVRKAIENRRINLKELISEILKEIINDLTIFSKRSCLSKDFFLSWLIVLISGNIFYLVLFYPSENIHELILTVILPLYLSFKIITLFLTVKKTGKILNERYIELILIIFGLILNSYLTSEKVLISLILGLVYQSLKSFEVVENFPFIRSIIEITRSLVVAILFIASLNLMGGDRVSLTVLLTLFIQFIISIFKYSGYLVRQPIDRFRLFNLVISLMLIDFLNARFM